MVREQEAGEAFAVGFEQSCLDLYRCIACALGLGDLRRQ